MKEAYVQGRSGCLSAFQLSMASIHRPHRPSPPAGANYIRSASGGGVRSLLFGDRNRAAQDLRIGDVVERHLMDGDPVLFNRQARGMMGGRGE